MLNKLASNYVKENGLEKEAAIGAALAAIYAGARLLPRALAKFAPKVLPKAGKWFGKTGFGKWFGKTGFGKSFIQGAKFSNYNAANANIEKLIKAAQAGDQAAIKTLRGLKVTQGGAFWNNAATKKQFIKDLASGKLKNMPNFKNPYAFKATAKTPFSAKAGNWVGKNINPNNWNPYALGVTDTMAGDALFNAVLSPDDDGYSPQAHQEALDYYRKTYGVDPNYNY